MIDRYYYLIASLPNLEFEKPAPISVAEFLERCRRELSSRHWQILRAVKLFESESLAELPELMDRWQHEEGLLRRSLARHRAQRLGRPKAEVEEGMTDAVMEEELEQLTGAAVEMDSPWEAEAALDRRRWLRLEEWERFHYFDLERLVVYHLKLLLLERRDGFAAARGWNRLEGFLQQAEEAATGTLAREHHEEA